MKRSAGYDVAFLAIALGGMIGLGWRLLTDPDRPSAQPSPTSALVTASSERAKPEVASSGATAPSASTIRTGPGITAGTTCGAVWVPGAPSPERVCDRSDGTVFAPIEIDCADGRVLIVGQPERLLLAGWRGDRLDSYTIEAAAELVSTCAPR